MKCPNCGRWYGQAEQWRDARKEERKQTAHEVIEIIKSSDLGEINSIYLIDEINKKFLPDK